MEKKEIYVLICVNEENSVVSVSLHNTQEEAHNKMQEEYDCELTGMFDDCADDDDYEYVESTDISSTTAYINYGTDLTYRWTIIKTKEV